MRREGREPPLGADSRVVIVGAGHAGVQAAAQLRHLGFTGDLTLLNEETSDPYDRPALSKEFLASHSLPVKCLRSREFFDEARIELTHARASELDAAARRVRAQDGRSWEFDHLVLATGGRPRPLRIPGANHAGVLALRSLADATNLRARLSSSRRMVVIGGGFIGLEVAAAARAQGVDVVVVEAMDRLMARVISDGASRAALEFHRANGVEVLLERGVTALEGDGTVSAVRLDDGTSVSADLVVVGVGMVPNDRLAAAAGLATGQGVEVDEMLRTSCPGISAIGDCAVVVTPSSGGRRRLESIPNANDQAHRVAERLLGRALSASSAPWFWSHQGQFKLQLVGLSSTSDHHVVIGSPEKFSVLCFREDRLSAVESVNDPATHLAARRILDRSPTTTFEDCRAGAFDLRRMARQEVGVGRTA